MKPVILSAALAAHLVPAASVPERPDLPIPSLPALPGMTASPPFLPPALGAAVKGQTPAPVASEPVQAARALFDGGRAAKPGEGWSLGAFEGDGGAPVVYKSREGVSGGVARVYAGGLALNESFEPLFARPEKPAGRELFLWTRGHPPTGWVPTKAPIDADARDLAAAINIAAEKSPEGKVELALHSFGTLVFQRMIQLHAEPAVKAALAALKDQRVFLLHATTHYDGSERRAGRDFERMGQATRTVIDWLNAGDATVEMWEATARLNPLLIPSVAALREQWSFQRGQVISMAAREAASMMKKDLSETWDAAYDHLRKAFLKDLESDSHDLGWQESLLRRSSDMFRLEFSPEDAARIKKLGIRLELVHADGDQLLNWESALALFERLGIEAPAKAPPSGTVLTDKSGRFRARIVSGDHYWPLKRRDELAAILR